MSLVGTLVAGATLADSPDTPELSESGVKAAFLLNFLQFVRWPETRLPAGVPLELCVAADEKFLQLLKPLATKASIAGRPVQVRPVSVRDSLKTCHALYLGRYSVQTPGPFLSSIGRSEVLTVADVDDFLAAGGVIQLVTGERKALFDVSIVAARAARLEVSARLLQLARQVIQ